MTRIGQVVFVAALTTLAFGVGGIVHHLDTGAWGWEVHYAFIGGVFGLALSSAMAYLFAEKSVR